MAKKVNKMYTNFMKNEIKNINEKYNITCEDYPPTLSKLVLYQYLNKLITKTDAIESFEEMAEIILYKRAEAING